MTEAEWAVSSDPRAMLEWLMPDGEPTGRAYAGVSRRKLALFACACARLGRDGMPLHDRRVVEAVEDMEGEPTDYLAIDHLLIGGPHRWALHHAARASDAATKASLLRCLFGNPFRPVSVLCPADDYAGIDIRWPNGSVGRYQAWLTPLVRELAEAAYEGREMAKCPDCGNESGYRIYCDTCKDSGRCGYAPTGRLDAGRLGVLCDALVEAGLPEEERKPCPRCEGYSIGKLLRCPDCDNRGHVVEPHPLLAHLRNGGGHWRGCWAIDLLTGRE